MNPSILLGTADIPNGGGVLRLTQRGNDFSIHLKGLRGELMNSRVYASEIALAELGCAHIRGVDNSKVVVGGLGMGFTLAAALKAVTKSSQVIVAELVPEVVEWNKGQLSDCAGKPLEDNRVLVHLGDVAELFQVKQARATQSTYDAVLLDVDNGPEGFTHADNNNLYSLDSLGAIRQTLRAGGMLAIWSAWHDPKFTLQLKKARFDVEVKTVRAHKGKGCRYTIYLAKKK